VEYLGVQEVHYPVPSPADRSECRYPQAQRRGKLEPRPPPIPCTRMQVNSQGGGEGHRPRPAVAWRAPGPKG